MDKLIALICRHGETQLNADNKFRSWLDVPLDAKGEQQAEEMANVLWSSRIDVIEYPIDTIISSPLIRTITTANKFAPKVNLPVLQNRGLFPWNLGILSGTDKTENKDILKLFVDNPSIKILNGESLEDFEKRSAEFFNEILFKKDRKGIDILFAHTSNIIVLEGLIKGTRQGPESIELVQPGGICAIYQTGDWFRIEAIFRATNELEI